MENKKRDELYSFYTTTVYIAMLNSPCMYIVDLLAI